MARGLRDRIGKRPGLVLFFVALLVRLVFGAISFGSVDLMNSIESTPRLLANYRWEEVPYLPVLSTFIFLGGVIALKTAIPIALAYKLFPILFDSFLAVLIHDVVRRRAPRGALAAGMLYALSPVAVLIVCFHAQWDPIWIFFIVLAFHVREDFAESHGKYALFGGLFGVSLLFKPVALIVLPFFLTADALRRRSRRALHYQVSAVAGLAGVLTLACLCFVLAGYSLPERAEKIAKYSAGGVIIFGLPFAYPLDQLVFLRTRLWLLAAVLALVLPYARHRVDVFTAALLAFLLALGMSGLAPQYLFWPLPFLLLTGRLAFAAFYNILMAIFFLLYYLNPLASYVPAENMSTFALLVPLRWAMPPAGWTDAQLMPVVRLLGNYVIPLFSLAVAWRILSKAHAPVSTSERTETLSLASLWPVYGRVLVCGSLATVALRMVLSFSPEFAAAFTDDFVLARLRAYSLNVMSEGGPIVGLYPEKSIFHLGWLVLIGALAWSIAAVTVCGGSLGTIPHSEMVE